MTRLLSDSSIPAKYSSRYAFWRDLMTSTVCEASKSTRWQQYFENSVSNLNSSMSSIFGRPLLLTSGYALSNSLMASVFDMAWAFAALSNVSPELSSERIVALSRYVIDLPTMAPESGLV